MTRRPFPTNPAYLQSLRGLHRLHALTQAGQSQSPEADALRDSLEAPWDALSEAEQQRINGLSEDLYSLSDPPAEPEPPNPQATRNLIETAEARLTGEWDRALKLLRRWGRYLSPADLSFQRGCVWREAGDDATAAIYFRHAAELEPQNEKYAASYLRELHKSDVSRAIARAQEILTDDQSHPPLIVAVAGNMLFASTSSMDYAERTPILRQLVRVMERTLQRPRPESSEPPTYINSIYIPIIALLAACHTGLGETSIAVHFLDLGLAADPDSPVLLLARGVARYGKESGAADDISRAIRRGSEGVGPYFFLAHHNLVTGRFDECLRMCDRALDLPAEDEMRARLHGWRAIAKAELGFPTEMVRADFEEAVRLAPEDDEIRRNFEAFNRSGGQPGARPHDWATPRASTIQALYRAEPGPLMPAA